MSAVLERQLRQRILELREHVRVAEQRVSVEIRRANRATRRASSTLALLRRSRCVYCGAPSENLVCAGHTDLLAVDPEAPR